MRIALPLEILNFMSLDRSKPCSENPVGWARELERIARLRDPAGWQFPEEYVKAAKLRLKARQIGKAIKDYESAVQIYDKHIQGIYNDRREYNAPEIFAKEEVMYMSLKERAERNANRLRNVQRGKWFGLTGIVR